MHVYFFRLFRPYISILNIEVNVFLLINDKTIIFIEKIYYNIYVICYTKSFFHHTVDCHIQSIVIYVTAYFYMLTIYMLTTVDKCYSLRPEIWYTFRDFCCPEI